MLFPGTNSGTVAFNPPGESPYTKNRTAGAAYLSVKFSSAVEERPADVMQAVRVASGVLQAGEGAAANLERTAQATGHVCCGQRRDHQWGARGG